MNRVNRIIEAGINVNDASKSRIEDIQFYCKYSEPGYDNPKSGSIALGNWNPVAWVEGRNEAIERVAMLLERCGVELEWSDEWLSCSKCNGLTRMSQNSYGWQRSNVIIDGEVFCHNCVDPTEYLESIEGKSKTCNTMKSINPADYNYIRLDFDFENGFHHGQDADPRLIGQLLRSAGIKRYLFDLESVGQFDMSFAVFVHEDENLELAAETLRKGKTDGPSNAAAMERGLKEASIIMDSLPEGQGIKYVKVIGDKAEGRIVSPDEFINGIKD